MADHVDSAGFLRRGNQWGFNSFVNDHDVISSVRKFARRGSSWALWRLPDGTYTHTILGVTPEDNTSVPKGSIVTEEFTV